MAISLLTRAQEFLRLKVSQMSPAMQQDFENGNLNFADSVYYKRFEITGLQQFRQRLRRRLLQHQQAENQAGLRNHD